MSIREQHRTLTERIRHAEKEIVEAREGLLDLNDDIYEALREWLTQNGVNRASQDVFLKVITNDLEGLLGAFENLGYI